MLRKPDLEPTVITKVEDSGVELTLRYLCRPDIEERQNIKSGKIFLINLINMKYRFCLSYST